MWFGVSRTFACTCVFVVSNRMTRETKIGLLVGLAFIIVIGILLSDHMTSSTEPPQATLAQAGPNARTAIATPGATAAPPITNVVSPATVNPQNQIPTTGDLQPKPQPVQMVNVGGPQQSAPTGVVSIGPGTQQPQSAQLQDSGLSGAGLNAPVVITPVRDTQVAVTQTPEPAVQQFGTLQQIARQQGEELVSAGGQDLPAARTTSAAAAGMKSYVAESGDSVSRLAARFLGANTKANRDAILNANPTLKANPDRMIVGKTYLIPTTAEAPAKPVASVAAASTENWYTVKEGDTLWKIARDECGNQNAVAAIKELNKETLKGSDTVLVDMKLRLPNKPVALNR